VPWLALAIVFGADQATKVAVIQTLVRGESWPADGLFKITHAWNTGTAFGLFPQYGGLLTLISLAAVVVLFLFYRSAGSPSLYVRTAFGMQLGGAFGNLFDRIRLGHVTDFIDVGPWPVFNIADSAIVVGIALMAWHFWSASSSGDKKSVQPGPPEDSRAPDEVQRGARSKQSTPAGTSASQGDGQPGT
jgi:signal peptidase II